MSRRFTRNNLTEPVSDAAKYGGAETGFSSFYIERLATLSVIEKDWSPMRRPFGFTLTEILVVIGIVALLSAIAFPVFFLVRARSHRTTCQSNLHQVYLALRQYVEDNDSTWPESDIWGKHTFTTTKLEGCPQVVPPPRPVGLRGVEGYAYNTALSPPSNDKRGMSDSAIKYPATTVSVGEAAMGVFRTYGPDPYHNVEPPAPEDQEKGWMRHNGGASYLFVDGHVKWYISGVVGYNDQKMNDGTFPTFSVGIPSTLKIRGE